MSYATVNGVRLYYEITGQSFPLVWCHEFAGDYRSWEYQVRFFSRRYQVITYNARGYPPSEVPTDPKLYSQDLAVEDLLQLFQHLGIGKAHIGGLSMGGNVALNFGIAYPEMAKSLIIAATGSGTFGKKHFEKRVGNMAKRLEEDGMKAMADRYSLESNRIQLSVKDPKSFKDFFQQLCEHSNVGSAFTAKGVMLKRSPLNALETKLKKIKIPTLIMVGDEDTRCVESALYMKKHIPKAGLVMFPRSGHMINLEEPDLFNRLVLDFLTSVDTETWK